MPRRRPRSGPSARLPRSSTPGWPPALAAGLQELCAALRALALEPAPAGVGGLALATALPERAPGVRVGPRTGADDDPIDRQPAVMALVERAQAGDGGAFGELYDRYVGLVYRYVRYRVGDEALAEDLTSETFLRALRRIGSFRWQGRDVGAWLVTIARNLLADHYKSGRYRLEISTDDLLDAAGDSATPGPELEVLDRLDAAVLLDAVKRLGPEQQECVALRFLEGLSVAETARSMGRNEGAVKALQYRAVRNLARLLPDGFVS